MSTINTLIEKLKACDDREYLDVLVNYKPESGDLEKHYMWSSDHPTRNCLHKSEEFELLLICWEEGQFTPVHDYNFKEAWVHTLSGKLREERFALDPFTSELKKVSSVSLEEDDYSFMNKVGGIHKFSNTGEGRSVSLHLYSNPIKEWRVYDTKTGDYTVEELSYDSYSGAGQNII